MLFERFFQTRHISPTPTPTKQMGFTKLDLLMSKKLARQFDICKELTGLDTLGVFESAIKLFYRAHKELAAGSTVVVNRTDDISLVWASHEQPPAEPAAEPTTPVECQEVRYCCDCKHSFNPTDSEWGESNLVCRQKNVVEIWQRLESKTSRRPSGKEFVVRAKDPTLVTNVNCSTVRQTIGLREVDSCGYEAKYFELRE